MVWHGYTLGISEAFQGVGLLGLGMNLIYMQEPKMKGNETIAHHLNCPFFQQNLFKTTAYFTIQR